MQTKDLSQGKPFKLILLYSLPMVLSVVFQQLYNIADSVIAGQMLGNDALAAVLVSYPITMIYMCVGTGLSVGCGVIISRTYGLKKIGALKTAVSTSFITIFVIGAIMIAVGFFSARPLLELLSTPTEILDDAAGYLKVYTLGMVFVYIYNACSVAFQALGNSKIPLFFLIFSTILNVVLDLLFLLGGGKVESLSTATVIAQGVACVGSVLVLCALLTGIGKETETPPQKRSFLKITKDTVKSLCMFFLLRKTYKIISKHVVSEIVRMGIPNVLQAATVSIGQLFIQNLVNGFGKDIVSGYGAAIKISTFLIQIMITESNALSMYISQNVGAGTHERISGGIKSGTIILFGSTVIAAVIGLVFAPQLISVFISGESSAAVIAIGANMLRIVVPFYFVIVFKFLFDALLKGTGSMLGFVSSTVVDLVTRVAFAYIISYALNSPIGIWWCWPIGWALGTIVSGIFVLTGGWRKKIAIYKTLS